MSMSFLYSPNDSPTSESFDEAEDVLRAYEAEQQNCTHIEREPDERASSSSSDEYSPRILRTRSRKRRSQSSTLDTRNRLSEMLRRHDELPAPRSLDATTTLPDKQLVDTPQGYQSGTKSFSLYRLSPMQARSLSEAVSNNYSAPDLSTEMRDSQCEQFGPGLAGSQPQTPACHHASTIYMIPEGKSTPEVRRKYSGNGHRRARSLSPLVASTPQVPPSPPPPRQSLYPTPAYSPLDSIEGIPQVKSSRRGFATSTFPLTPLADMEPILPLPWQREMDPIIPLPWIRKSRSIDANIPLNIDMDGEEVGTHRPASLAPRTSTDSSNPRSSTESNIPRASTESSAPRESAESAESGRVQSPTQGASHARIATPDPAESSRDIVEEEMLVRSRWSDESSSDEVVIRKSKSKSKQRDSEKAKVKAKTIPKIKTKSRPLFVPSIPSLPVKSLPAVKSLPVKEKWDVKRGVSGLFHKRMFSMNRVEVREIIDTSVKNPFSADPGKRYSRAGEADIPMLMMMEGSDGTPGPRKALKTLGLIDKDHSERARSATPEPGALILNSIDEDLNEADDEDEPAIDITSDLAMAVAEEETAISVRLRNRAIHRTVEPLPPISEISPNLERDSHPFSTIADMVTDNVTATEDASLIEMDYNTAINTPLPSSPRASEEFPTTASTEQPQQLPLTVHYPLPPRIPPPQLPLPPPPTSPPRTTSPSRTASVSRTTPPPRNTNLYHQALVRLSMPSPPPFQTKIIELRKPSSPIDYAVYQSAISGPTGDHLMAGFTPIAATSSFSLSEASPAVDQAEGLEDWIKSYNLPLGGMVSANSVVQTPRPSVGEAENAWEKGEDGDGDPVCPALEDDNSGSSKRSSSSTGPPDIGESTDLALDTTTTTTAVPTEEEGTGLGKKEGTEDKAKMSCSLNDETLGEFLISWEAAGAVSPVSPP